MAKLLIIIGVFTTLLGLTLKYAPWLISWFGHLPGDIVYRSENTQVYLPITSMMVISLMLSLIINILLRR